MDFQLAREIGYYFDRCIDLTFYNTDMEPIGMLKTPKRGMKPTITIKGLLIEGGYAIDSYISIQNMAFDIDIAYIGFIKARMYYSGIEESVANTVTGTKLKNGHTILFTVLYADQEKEPPNRCVRFQCVVASKDTTMFSTPVYISGGAVQYLSEGVDANSVAVVLQNKSSSSVTLKKLCEELIFAYNRGVSNNSNAGRKKDYYELLRISVLEIDQPLENITVELSSGEYTIGDLIRQLNSNATETNANGFSYSKFKIVIDRGTMRVSTPVPSNWKKVAKSEGFNKTNYEEYYNQKYASVKTNTYTIGDSIFTPNGTTPVVPLNYVKSATRSECVIYAETMFDDRITPGCHVAIKGTSIMGKRFGSSKGQTKGSRILHYAERDVPVVFRVTGKIEFLFSTTEDSYMKFQGPVDENPGVMDWIGKAYALRNTAEGALEQSE